MKNIMPFLIIGLFILSGLKVVATNNNLDNGLFLESNDPKIYIAPITIPNSQDYQIINGDGKQTNEELKIYSISYQQQSKNLENYGEIKEQHKSIKMLDNLQTYDYIIITTEDLNNAITSSMFLEWKNLIGYNVKSSISQTLKSHPKQVSIYLKKSETSLGRITKIGE
ncbi:hypothetical protein MBGDF03_00057 [Thermoplasmatales archaeon SCGC AB-540-F20]|nr:hypothetical protein MBGDF03_00057 [Thermoplasmatales archaeon SCGC AB-540-F20]